MGVFEQTSEQLFAHLLESSPEFAEKDRELITNQIEALSNQLFVERCLAVLVPEI
jgi:hypothetical protein